ncbi:4-alpha-glucanotransferase [Spirochaeta cellobiosiphila]|uniref:4-alpha-glucanotransferase n=1 Tax=Spirochaeta cellobiosiphila TaxID=504483 RepID=UPI00041A9186|nr:4-alpha-glucanotransferase [Spirochaeta cellobiosiphila]
MNTSVKNIYKTSVSIPLFSLSSESSVGCGEFLDLIPFGNWCKQVGIDNIHLLPVNDTGCNKSPYSTISTFALNPIYIQLQVLAHYENIKDDVEKSFKKITFKEHIDYSAVRNKKIKILRQLYHLLPKTWSEGPEINNWINDNTWVKSYSLFCHLLQKQHNDPWKGWKEYRTLEEEECFSLWNKKQNKQELYFYIWVQYELDKQFKSAVKHLENLGITLQCDLSLLVPEDSCDVWYHREIFKPRLHAGAPPEKNLPSGQNWGYSIYNWKNYRHEVYNYWDKRLNCLSQYFHSIRVSHAQGLFRIWCTPEYNYSGILGYYTPAVYIDHKKLMEFGFDDTRIKWLSLPHIEGSKLFGILGQEASKVIELALNQLPNEDLYLFKPFIKGEKVIRELPLSKEAKKFLTSEFNSRCLIEVSKDKYALAWNYKYSPSYLSLSSLEKNTLLALSEECQRDSQVLWKKQGTNTLQYLISKDLDISVETLGVSPEGIYDVLKDMNIENTVVLKWHREWNKYGSPFLKSNQYTYLSSCTLSTHNTNTAKQWLRNEVLSDLQKESLNLPLGENQTSFNSYKSLIKHLLSIKCRNVLLNIQDIINLDEKNFHNINDIIINDANTNNELNWSYKIPITIEELSNNNDLNTYLKRNIQIRRGMEDASF